jgi:hypothetical protein
MSGTEAVHGPSTIKRRKRSDEEEEEDIAMEAESPSTDTPARNNNHRSALAAAAAGDIESLMKLFIESEKGREAEKAGREAEKAGREAEKAGREAEKAGREAAEAVVARTVPTSLRTLLKSQEGCLTAKLTGSLYSHVNVKGHQEAEAAKGSFALFREDIDISKVPPEQTSAFLVQNIGTTWKEATIETEADVTRLVLQLVSDASRILNYVLGDFKIHVTQERSLFSGRPDIVVAYSSAYGIPLLVIEVKKPLPKGESVKDKKRVLGQLYDYAEFLDAIGNPLPFVIWTSFDESRICWNGSAKQGKVTKEFKAQVKIAPPPVDSPLSRKKSGDRLPASDSPPTLILPEEVDNSSGSPILFTKNAAARTLLLSDECKPHDLVYLFCNALFRAATASRKQEAMIHDLAWGTTYHFPKVVCFESNKQTCAWGSLTCRKRQPSPTTPSQSHSSSRKLDRKQRKSRSQSYYVIGKLGNGATSNVWHALDSKGNEVAIKMYVQTMDEMGQKLNSTDFASLAKDAVATEVERLKSFYPCLKNKVFQVMLNGFQCVVMPFFKPVPRLERRSVLQSVKVAYDNFKTERNNNTEHYMYNDCDVLWRHIGTYQEEQASRPQYILFDLADLKLYDAVRDDDELDKLRNGHIDTLELRIGDEAMAAEVPFARTPVSAEDGNCRVPIFATLPKATEPAPSQLVHLSPQK